MKRPYLLAVALVTVAWAGTCTPPACAAVAAIQEVTVRDDNGAGGFFNVDLEANYLPNVVLRENGAASFEALKAQAVAARTFAYYKLQSSAFIRNSTADQVYSTGGVRSNPGGLWDLAVQETAGEILTFNNILVASFYVAGAIPRGPTAVAGAGDPDPTNTERFVTYPYSAGLLGPFNTGSSLGFVGTPSNPNYPNRGAKSQNGADWQSDRGTHYYDILKFYYGGDIQLETVHSPADDPFGPRTLASFERNNDFFNRPLTFAGQARNLGGNTSVQRSGSFATTPGGTSQQLTLDYDSAADSTDGPADGFFARHLSGVDRAARLSNITSGTATNPVGDPIGNLVLPTTGSIGFWMLANPVDVDPLASLQVGLSLDDFGASSILGATTEQSTLLDVIVDGQWHKYEWFLDEPTWTSAFAPGVGDNQLGPRFTLDAILLKGFGDATVYLDDVFFDESAVIPEPGTALLVGLLAMIAASRFRTGRTAT